MTINVEDLFSMIPLPEPEHGLRPHAPYEPEHAPEQPEQDGLDAAMLVVSDPGRASSRTTAGREALSLLRSDDLGLSTTTVPDFAAMDLDAITAYVRQGMSGLASLHRRTMETGALVGTALVAAKSRLKAEAGHGSWLSWLRDEVGLGEDTAQRLMRLAKNLDLASTLPIGSTINTALKHVSEVKRQQRLEGLVQERLERAPQVRLPASLQYERGDLLLDHPWPTAPGRMDLIVTSPPYGLGIQYDNTDDSGGYEAYLEAVDAWAEALAALLNPAYGRLCLNVPLDVMRHEEPKPLAADWLAALRRHGFRYRTTVIVDDTQLGKKTAYGSLGSQAAPHVYAPVEVLLVCHLGAWGRAIPEGVEPDLPAEEHILWNVGLWRISHGGGWRPAWHPAPMPYALASRAVRLFSFPGDVVGDPFAGSGTTGAAAARLGRTAWLSDRSSRYVDLGRAELDQFVRMHGESVLSGTPDDSRL